MSIRSLGTRLGLFWLLIVATCLSLGLIMLEVYRQGAGVQVDDAKRATAQACSAIRDGYARSQAPTADDQAINADLLNVVLQLSLREAPGVEGGVWQPQQGFVAYAFPTYEGSGIKRDVPEAEQERIVALAKKVLAAGAAADDVVQGSREASVLSACVVRGALVAWTLKRVPAALGRAYDRLILGVGLLFVFVLVSGVWLAWLLRRWYHHVNRLEGALARHSLDDLPRLQETGELELDRIVGALNRFSDRLRSSQQESQRLGRELAQAERLAALGRMAAGIAHEIRNPLGAMRLKAENALAAPGERQPSALRAILEQIGRLDSLVSGLLALTQPFNVKAESVDVHAWLEAQLVAMRDRAEAAGVRLQGSCSVERWTFDPAQTARALDNLLLNALQHTPRDGAIDAGIETRDKELVIRVTDSGAGIASTVRDHLFEPFVTGRADGTGLGLALVREIATAQGGTVRTVDTPHGAVFELRLPWRAS
jgi:signal transduction histidine kinase